MRGTTYVECCECGWFRWRLWGLPWVAQMFLADHELRAHACVSPEAANA